MSTISAIRNRYHGHKKHANKNKGMSALVFKLEKGKREKRGKRLIDMSLLRIPTWMCWEVFKRRLWIVAIWTVGAIYFMIKYLMS